MHTIKLSAKAQNIIGTRKKKAFVSILTEPCEVNTASYWDSGSRDQFGVYSLTSKQTSIPFGGIYPTFDAKHKLLVGEVLIRRGTFQGKPATPSLTFICVDQPFVERDFDLDFSNMENF